jgi:hypothetical protein
MVKAMLMVMVIVMVMVMVIVIVMVMVMVDIYFGSRISTHIPYVAPCKEKVQKRAGTWATR